MRERGTFGNVSVSWQLFFNGTFLEPGQEFSESSGIVVFTTGEVASPVALHALPDGIPEFNETYVLRLLNVSGMNVVGQFMPNDILILILLIILQCSFTAILL